MDIVAYAEVGQLVWFMALQDCAFTTNFFASFLQKKLHASIFQVLFTQDL